MLSFTASSPTRFFLSAPHPSLSESKCSPFSSYFLLDTDHRKRLRKKREKLVTLSSLSMIGSFSLVGRRIFEDPWCGESGFSRRCKKELDSEGNFGLEAQILEFMKESKNPQAFPRKKELIAAGRLDLVEGIMKQGGWLLLGWDTESDETDKDWNFEASGVELDWRSGVECNSEVIQEMGFERNGERSSEFGFADFHSYSSASSSGRSLETAAQDDSGIDGILSRLKKERDMNLRTGLRERGNAVNVQTNDPKRGWLPKVSKNTTVSGQKRSNGFAPWNLYNGKINDSGSKLGHDSPLSKTDDLRNSHKPDTWRTWSIQRAGFSDIGFEAGEISFSKSSTEIAVDALQDKLQVKRDRDNESLKGQEKNCRLGINQIRSRLQNLELELSSTLRTLKSSTGDIVSPKGSESSSDDFLKLSDAWEFQENEIMNAQDKLRSIRAKLAVVEGKMALAIIDAKRIAEEKQKRIDDARRALRLLRTACIVWPNSASEVLLTGSFDGWVTKRRMEKSSTGIFSVCLKLYPGKYEIKFIVDGEWKVDPLRPIIHNNGYENNLLIVT